MEAQWYPPELQARAHMDEYLAWQHVAIQLQAIMQAWARTPRAGRDQLAHIPPTIHCPRQTWLIYHSTLSPEPERNFRILNTEPTGHH